MANMTGFVVHREFGDSNKCDLLSVDDDCDYTLWRDDNFELLARFNLFSEAKQFGLQNNYFFTSFALNSKRYGKHGLPFVESTSVVSFLKAVEIAQISSLPNGVEGNFLESRVFSFDGIKLIVEEKDFRGLFKYFDFKILLGELYQIKSIQGILGQTLLPLENWQPCSYWRV